MALCTLLLFTATARSGAALAPHTWRRGAGRTRDSAAKPPRRQRVSAAIPRRRSVTRRVLDDAIELLDGRLRDGHRRAVLRLVDLRQVRALRKPRLRALGGILATLLLLVGIGRGHGQGLFRALAQGANIARLHYVSSKGEGP